MKDSCPLRRLLLLAALLPVDKEEEEQVNSSGRHLQSGFDAVFTPPTPPLLRVLAVAVLTSAGDNEVVVAVASRV